MATTRASQRVKLGQFLLEQQEPFILEVYLSERGLVKKGYKSEANSGCCCSNSSRNRKRIPHGSKVLRAVYNKLISRNKNSENKDGKPKHRNIQEQEGAEPDRFSSTSSITVYNSCPDTDIEEPSTTVNNSQFDDQREKEADTEGKFQWNGMEDSKQQRPVSVLEKLPCSRTFPLHQETEDFMISDSTSDFLLQSTTEKSGFAGTREFQELVWINPQSPFQYLISKRVLHQTKQLLFDCVRELVQSHEGKERRQSDSKEVFGAGELRQLLCVKLEGWGEQSVKLLDSDFVNSSPEWSDFDSVKRDLGLEIGDAILEDITEEIMIDMNDLKARMKGQFSQ
ncbi:hypothetical protein SLEP1_g21772 [Rubroshorea leprosula]|uniref:DUF4378 domain-containing protein n=1 Tax=Rubroshorea leprosula TaxID=152421 RepID=A0AAV5J742_9ROSI|nr:hypothetical protein SLEP1_g21772 [Rubroshorea leprosula]